MIKNKILLIEDELKTGDMLKKALESEGIDVEWVIDGSKAENAIEKGKFDLVVLDLKLPEVSGEQVLEYLRTKDPYVEVVIYTNYQDPPIMKKLINLGVDGYINKGAEADLWATVKVIKDKLDPFSEGKKESILQSINDDVSEIPNEENK
jgi:DNA-binding response OmpR family regulator